MANPQLNMGAKARFQSVRNTATRLLQALDNIERRGTYDPQQLTKFVADTMFAINFMITYHDVAKDAITARSKKNHDLLLEAVGKADAAEYTPKALEELNQFFLNYGK